MQAAAGIQVVVEILAVRAAGLANAVVPPEQGRLVRSVLSPCPQRAMPGLAALVEFEVDFGALMLYLWLSMSGVLRLSCLKLARCKSELGYVIREFLCGDLLVLESHIEVASAAHVRLFPYIESLSWIVI